VVRLIVLVQKEDREHVREMREIDGRVPEQSEEKEMVGVYQKLRQRSLAPADRRARVWAAWRRFS
jgi:hypothetical protein